MRGGIEVISDGSSAYGYGHLRRSLTLVEEFRENGIPVRFTPRSENASGLVPAQSDFTGNPAAVLLDLPYAIDAALVEIRRPATRYIALDYFGLMVPDLTISVFEHHDPVPPGRRLAGLEYAIVRPEIRQGSPVKSAGRVLVMIGGGDINQKGPVIAQRLSDSGWPVDLIEGPVVTRPYPEFTDRPEISVWRSPKNLGTLMRECSWAVANGGGSMLELLSLGKAVFVDPQTMEERRLAEIVRGHGALLGIGLETLSIPGTDQIRATGECAARIVDGAGAFRILQAMRELMDGAA